MSSLRFFPSWTNLQARHIWDVFTIAHPLKKVVPIWEGVTEVALHHLAPPSR